MLRDYLALHHPGLALGDKVGGIELLQRTAASHTVKHPGPVLAQAEDVFRYRNRLAHGRPDGGMDMPLSVALARLSRFLHPLL
jgi:hypothetical protein